MLEGLAQARPGLRLTGTEIYAEAIAFAERRVPAACFVRADARRLPLGSAFDAAGAFDVLEHILEEREVLAELRRVLRPGGGLLLTVPQHPGLWTPSDDPAGHVRRYSRTGLRRLVEEEGFEVFFATGFVSLLFPLMAAARREAKRRRRRPTPWPG